jgi:hypothetical protein
VLTKPKLPSVALLASYIGLFFSFGFVFDSLSSDSMGPLFFRIRLVARHPSTYVDFVTSLCDSGSFTINGYGLCSFLFCSRLVVQLFRFEKR